MDWIDRRIEYALVTGLPISNTSDTITNTHLRSARSGSSCRREQCRPRGGEGPPRAVADGRRSVPEEEGRWDGRSTCGSCGGPRDWTWCVGVVGDGNEKGPAPAPAAGAPTGSGDSAAAPHHPVCVSYEGWVCRFGWVEVEIGALWNKQSPGFGDGACVATWRHH